ncbi:MAG: hypothetical protein EPN26_12230 [Rhodospirillales bacterium]|nr:MAG: hypothetical protein EPN26_12230 [Rhodospirillales bacterium]
MAGKSTPKDNSGKLSKSSSPGKRSGLKWTLTPFSHEAETGPAVRQEESADCGKCLRKVWRVFRWFLPVIALIYLGLVFREMWNVDKGARRFDDKEAMQRLIDAGCGEIKKHAVPSFVSGRNYWLFHSRTQGALYLDALEEKPECLALRVLAWTPSRDSSADVELYYYDKNTNLPVVKVTVEYLNPRRL